MHQQVETLVLPGSVDMWSFDPMIDGGEISLGTKDPIQRLVYYACSPRTHVIVNYSIQKASKSCHIVVYGPVADFEGEPADPGEDAEPEQRIFVRACVRRTALSLLDYEIQRRFSAALEEKTDCIKAAPKKHKSAMTARNLRGLLNLPSPVSELGAE